ncbi:WD40 repeat protein [Cryptosporidium canis]|nr:WD40 repeat protein [Cryptosporidium canis]
MNRGYKGGCFSLKVPPVFCRNGGLILIPKGRSNEISVYETLGAGEPVSRFSASNEVITGLGVLKPDESGEELLITSTLNGSIKVFSLDDVLDQKEKPLLRATISQSIIDLKVARSNVYILAGEASGQDSVVGPNVSLYKIARSDIASRVGSGHQKPESKLSQKLIKKVVDFSYGAFSFQVSLDESLICFIWKNILLLWSADYPDKIIRFRHSEYILSLTISEDKRFVATGDAYGRLTYWFIPPVSSKEGTQMWKNSPSISEVSDFEKMVYKYNVKTSISHWHSHQLTCLNMIPGTEVVLSGGEEAVLVLWRQTFASDSYLISTKSSIKNPNNNGTRQFIPRLGAPIYNITSFKKERLPRDVTSHSPEGKSDSVPSLMAAVVCSDNSIKVIDLVHNKVLNSIYGVSTPFNLINYNSVESPNLKMLGSYLFNPTRLLLSIIGHPFKLHVHDLVKDSCYSSLLCKPEESYVSKVGQGLASSKLVQEDVTRVVLADAYFSRDARFAVTVESQKFDHTSREKKVYNLQFWRITISKEGTQFELMSKYPIAHIDSLVSVEEAKSDHALAPATPREDSGLLDDDTCFITTTCRREIKCWIYKSQVKEWVNSSIINGDLDTEVYSTCFSPAFNKLFLASSKGIIIYNWNRQHSILLESDSGYLSGGNAPITQMTTFVYMNEHYLLGLSSSPAKLFIWSITSMKLVLEEEIDLGPHFKLISCQDSRGLHGLVEDVSFQFAVVKDKSVGRISLYKLGKDKKSKSSPPIKLHHLKDLEVDLFEGTSIQDVAIQAKVEHSKIGIYLVLLLSSCDIYMEEIEVVDRSDAVSKAQQDVKVFSHPGSRSSLKETGDDRRKASTSSDPTETERSTSIVDIQESIEKMFLDSTRDGKAKDSTSSPAESGLSGVSKTVQSIISHSEDPSKGSHLGTDQVASSFSSLYCQKHSSSSIQSLDKRSIHGLSRGLNTCMCPPPSNLFWNLVSGHSFSSLSRVGDYDKRSGTGSHVRMFEAKDAGRLNEIRALSPGDGFESLGDELQISQPLRPVQTQKLQSILKNVSAGERK